MAKGGKLKRIRLHAPRPTVIPGLGLPLVPAIGIFYGVLLTVVIFRGWKAWLILFIFWGLVIIAARTRVMRDHNAFRVDQLWLGTKAFFLDTARWRGVTLRAFPPRDKRVFRGTFA